MRALSVTEQKYQAVLAVIGEGRTVSEVAEQWRVSRRTLHRWLARYEVGGLEGLKEQSHRPDSCPHQMSGEVEALVLELRRWRQYWGPRNLVLELARRRLQPLPSESYSWRQSDVLPGVEARDWHQTCRAAPPAGFVTIVSALAFPSILL